MGSLSDHIIFYCLLISVASAVEYKLSGNEGTIVSENYPNTYPDNADVTWSVVVDRGSRIFISFTEFDLESSFDDDLGGPCVYDYLEVKEGDNVIKRYCGNQDKHPLDAPSPESYIETCGNEMTLHLVSDFSNVDPLPKGFRAIYKKIGVTCGEAGTPENGAFRAVGGVPYVAGTVLEYSCDDGFRVEGLHEGESDKLFCQVDGTWSSAPPICVVSGCRDIEPPRNGRINSADQPPYKTGAVLQFTCEDDYRIVGNDRVICLETREWSNEVPTCHVKECQQRDEDKAGRECRKACVDDDVCRGANKKCICDGWCGLSCFNPDAECPDLVSPPNGYIEYDGHSYGESLTYRCHKGFTVNGLRTRICQSDKNWSGDSAPKCVPYTTCGQAGDVGEFAHVGRVVDGIDANMGAWPWQALFLEMLRSELGKVEYTERVKGGGTIINEKWILSAAHVFNNTRFTLTKEEVLIFIGMTKLPDKGSYFPEHVDIHSVEEIIQNRQFNEINYDHDVALIRVGNRLRRRGNSFVVDVSSRKTITYTEYIRPVCLICLGDDDTYDEDECDEMKKRFEVHKRKKKHVGFVTGFGHTNENGVMKIPKILKQGAVTVLPDSRCDNEVSKIRDSDENFAALKFTKTMLCAGSEDADLNTDSCQGDSGGPLVRQFERKSMWYYYQIAIVSWGEACGSDYPGYYTDLTEVMPWISEQINRE